jgi:hypothetical protein
LPADEWEAFHSDHIRYGNQDLFIAHMDIWIIEPRTVKYRVFAGSAGQHVKLSRRLIDGCRPSSVDPVVLGQGRIDASQTPLVGRCLMARNRIITTHEKAEAKATNYKDGQEDGLSKTTTLSVIRVHRTIQNRRSVRVR